MIDIKTVKLRSECEIMASWKEKEKIVVSVICATFNHELYVEDAIIGFLMQETSFAFEVIIHDDASTDQTASIIKRYQEQYSNIIKPIYQTENQYSKGGFKPALYMAKRAKGEFLAWCEGDDYWIDKNKLNSQIKELNKRPNVDICIHDAFINKGGDWNSDYKFPFREGKIQIIDYIELYKSRGQFSPTASMIIRAKVLHKSPSFIYSAPIGDFFIEALSGRNGSLYLPDKMSVYRRAVEGSWSSVTLSSIDKKIDFNLKMLSSLLELEAYLSDSESKFVKYKAQLIFLCLALFYLQRGELNNAIKYQLKSLKGRLFIKCHVKFFIKVIKKVVSR